jgi:hypothetical protein
MTDRGNVFNLPPHDRMTPEECLSFCAREAKDWTDVIVLAVDQEGELVILASKDISRQHAVWLLLEALDHARGVVTNDQ